MVPVVSLYVVLKEYFRPLSTNIWVINLLHKEKILQQKFCPDYVKNGVRMYRSPSAKG